MTLTDDIQRLLGVVPPPTPYTPAVAHASSIYAHAVPDRPEPKYKFTVDVSRSEYGSATVYATSSGDARDVFDWGDIDWYDYGDSDITNVEQDSDEIVNQDDIDAWDAQFATKYTIEGLPMCSQCHDETHPDQLTASEHDDTWRCTSCLDADVAF